MTQFVESIFSLKNEPGEKIYFSHKMSLEGRAKRATAGPPFLLPKSWSASRNRQRKRVRIDWSARGRAQADAQGRGDDGAGSEESIGKQTL